MRATSLPTRVFAIIGALLLAGAVVLRLLDSFAYLGAAALGLFFIAAALIFRTAPPTGRVPPFLALVGVALSLVGTVTTIPFLYVGVGLIAAAVAIAALSAVRSRSPR